MLNIAHSLVRFLNIYYTYLRIFVPIGK